jgi:hypothetical protein
MFNQLSTGTTLPFKPEGNNPLERPRYKWENNIKIDLS